MLVCYASLCNADGTQDRSLVQAGGHSKTSRQPEEQDQTQHSVPSDKVTDHRTVHAMVGNLVAVSQALKDERNTLRLMFIFADLSVRLADTYALKFQLVDISAGYKHQERNLFFS